MNAERADRGFTLLEIMVTLAIVGGAMVLVLGQRENALIASYQARNANIARSMARELLSELEFHELTSNTGSSDKYPGFEYDIEIEEQDLLTGKEDDDKDPNNDNSGSRFSDKSRFSDAVDAAEEEEEEEFPVRRVKLTIHYPNVRRQANGDDRLNLVVETIFPALPQKDDGKNPFSSQSKAARSDK